MNFIESFDQNKLHYILSHPEEFEPKISKGGFAIPMSPACRTFLTNREFIKDDVFDYFAMPKKYLNLSLNGRQSVCYNYSKSSNDKSGRLFAADSMSLQNMPRLIRNTIAGDLYQDIDMVNAHPTILLMLCKKHDVRCSKLRKYVEKRDSVLKKVMDDNDVTRDVAKQVFLSLMNGGNASYKKLEKKSKFLTNYKKEMKLILERFGELYPEVYAERQKLSPNNPLGSTMNVIVCGYENTILVHMIDHFKKLNIIKNNAVLCFDGLMVPKTNEDLKLKDLERSINDKFRVEMKLKEKDMDERLKLPKFVPYYKRDPNDFIVTDKILPFLQLRDECQKIEKEISTDYDNIDGDSTDFETQLEDLASLFKAKIRRIVTRYAQYIIFERTEGKLYARLLKMTPREDNTQKIRTAFHWEMSEVTRAFKQAFDIVVKHKQLGVSISILDHVIEYCKHTVTVDAFQNFPGRPLFITKTINGNKAVILNAWRGRAMTPESIISEIEESLTKKEIKTFRKRIKKHIYDIFANGTKVEGEYIENWLACCVNDPTFFPGVASSFTSLPGAGKSRFLDNIFSQYFGSAYARTSGFDPSALGNDSIFMGTDIVVVDEIQITDKDSFDRVKNIITENTIKVRQMYRSAQTGVLNNTKFMFNSNHIDPFPFEGPNQRRFAKFRCSDSVIGDDKYFDQLYDDIPSLFYPYYFITMWTEEFEEQMKKYKFRNPKTIENDKSKAGHLSVVTKFCVDLSRETLNEKDTSEMSMNDLYDLFTQFCDSRRIKFVLNKHNFARNEDLKAILIDSDIRKRVGGKRTYVKVLNSSKTVEAKIKERFDLTLDDLHV